MSGALFICEKLLQTSISCYNEVCMGCTHANDSGSDKGSRLNILLSHANEIYVMLVDTQNYHVHLLTIGVPFSALHLGMLLEDVKFGQ